MKKPVWVNKMVKRKEIKKIFKKFIDNQQIDSYFCIYELILLFIYYQGKD
jgi:hypothetical protein